MKKRKTTSGNFNADYFQRVREDRHKPFEARAHEVTEWIKSQDANWMMSVIQQRMQRGGRPLDTVGILDEVLHQWFEKSGQAVVILSANHRVLLVNNMADAILKQQASWTLDDGYLKGVTLEHDKKLKKAISGLTNANVPDDRERPLLTLCDSDGDVAHFVVAETIGTGSKSIVVLTLTAPQELPNIDTDRLRAWYGLSKKEAKLASAFSRGIDLKDFAAETGVSINTVRTQFANIKAKMGAPNIATVVRLTLLASARKADFSLVN